MKKKFTRNQTPNFTPYTTLIADGLKIQMKGYNNEIDTTNVGEQLYTQDGKEHLKQNSIRQEKMTDFIT